MLLTKIARLKPQIFKKTTTPTRGTLYCIRAAHLLSILSSASRDAQEADRLGRIIECCVVIGSVWSGTETVSSRQRYPIREPLWNGAGQLL